MGDWLKIYGESIYGTRGGLVTPRDWGVTTQKGNTLYVHILNYKDNSLYLPTNGKKVRSARVFVDKKPVKFTQDADGVLLKLDKVPNELDYVVELELR
jgi:alpha-L-fucosidase